MKPTTTKNEWWVTHLIVNFLLLRFLDLFNLKDNNGPRTKDIGLYPAKVYAWFLG
jgi:hypothetical protein